MHRAQPFAFGLGTWPLGGQAYGSVDPVKARNLLVSALDQGIQIFDTAGTYGDGRVETLLGSVIPTSSEVTIISKAGYVSDTGDAQDFSETSIIRSVELSLARLRRSKLDCLLLHSPPAEVLRQQSVWKTFDRLKQRGLVRNTGVSLRVIEDADLITTRDDVQVVELIYNLLDQRAADNRTLERLSRKDIFTIARLPLCSGFLSPRISNQTRFSKADTRSRWDTAQIDRWVYGRTQFAFLSNARTNIQSALAFCAASPGLSCAIPGAKSIAQLTEALESRHMPLTRQEYQRCRAVWSNISHSVLPN